METKKNREDLRKQDLNEADIEGFRSVRLGDDDGSGNREEYWEDEAEESEEFQRRHC